MVKNLSASEGDTGFIPGLGGSHKPQNNEAHEPQLLSPCARAQEPQLLSPCALGPGLRSKRSQYSEEAAHRNLAPAQPKLKCFEKIIYNNKIDKIQSIGI